MFHLCYEIIVVMFRILSVLVCDNFQLILPLIERFLCTKDHLTIWGHLPAYIYNWDYTLLNYTLNTIY